MKKIMVAGFLLLLLHTATAQTANKYEPSLNNYYNNFQDFTNSTPNADSAFFYLQKLASEKKFLFYFTDIVHNSLAQSFSQKTSVTGDSAAAKAALTSRLLAKQILRKMMFDNSSALREAGVPITLLISMQEAAGNQHAQSVYTNGFMSGLLSDKFLYNQRSGRYGLMIYQLIESEPALKPLAEKLLHQLHELFKKGLVNATDSMSRAALDQRAWYRFMYASANYFEAGIASNAAAKMQFLKNAFDFSPDLFDRDHSSAYFYDKVMLFDDEEKSFTDDYLSALTTAGVDKSIVLSTLLKTALVEPKYKAKLAEYYKASRPSSKPFKAFWMAAVDSVAVKAPPFMLRSASKKTIGSKQLAGKWTVVDFWGTWCGPCREEHPVMQQFYDSIVVPKSKQIALLTIACRDTQAKVAAYMLENKYSFPALLSDEKIEHQFFVKSYPTKILVTPKGKYITVPFNIDWVNFVTQYCDL